MEGDGGRVDAESRVRVARLLIAAGLIAAVSAYLLWVTRGQTLFGDEWGFFTRSAGFDLGRMLEPDQGNLVFSTVLLYKLVFSIFGAEHHLALRIAWVALDVTCAALVFAWLRRRVGDFAALVPAVVLAVFGISWEFFGSTLGIPVFLCVAAGLAALHLLDHPGDRLEEGMACLLLLVSLSALSTGLAFAAGAAALILIRPGWRGRIWAVAVPIALYAAWALWARKFGQSEITLETLAAAPASIVESLAATSASIFGAFRESGPVEGEKLVTTVNLVPGLLLGALLVVAAAWRVSKIGFQRDLIVPVAMLAAYWGAIAVVSPAREADSGRYQYAAAIFVLLLFSELWRGFRPTRGAMLGIAAVGVVAIVPQAANVGYAGEFIRATSERDRAKLTVVDALADRAPSGSAVERPPFGPGADVVIEVGDYLRAAEDLGSPAYSRQELVEAGPEPRAAADRELVWLLQLVPEAGGATAGRCRSVPAGTLEGNPGFRVPAGGFSFESADGSEVTLGLRRYGDVYQLFEPSAPPGPYRIDIPADSDPKPWLAALESAGPMRVCSAAASG